MSGGLAHQRVVCQSVQPDGREVIRDRALGLGLTAAVMVFEPPPVLLQVWRLYVPLEGKVLGNGLRGPGPSGGSGAATCGSQTPMGLCTWADLGGPDLPSPRGGGPVTPRAAEEAAPRPTMPRVR
jgi:hypothetical protein